MNGGTYSLKSTAFHGSPECKIVRHRTGKFKKFCFFSKTVLLKQIKTLESYSNVFGVGRDDPEAPASSVASNSFLKLFTSVK